MVLRRLSFPQNYIKISLYYNIFDKIDSLITNDTAKKHEE